MMPLHANDNHKMKLSPVFWLDADEILLFFMLLLLPMLLFVVLAPATANRNAFDLFASWEILIKVFNVLRLSTELDSMLMFFFSFSYRFRFIWKRGELLVSQSASCELSAIFSSSVSFVDSLQQME